jgi:hypothetical protein
MLRDSITTHYRYKRPPQKQEVPARAAMPVIATSVDPKKSRRQVLV